MEAAFDAETIVTVNTNKVCAVCGKGQTFYDAYQQEVENSFYSHHLTCKHTESVGTGVLAVTTNFACDLREYYNIRYIS